MPNTAPAPARPTILAALGKRFWGIPLWLLLWGWIGLVILPMVGTLIQAFGREWFDTVLPQHFTTEWVAATHRELDLLTKLWNSAIIAILVVVLSLGIALPAAYGLARYDFPGKVALSTFLLIPILLPPLTYGFPVAQIMIAIGLSNTHLGIALAQCIDIVPYVLLMLRGVIAGIPVALEEQAATLGANSLQVVRQVIMPLILPGISAATAWAVAKSFSEVPLTVLVFGANTQTLATVLFANFDSSSSTPGRDAALVLWLFVPSAILLLFTMRMMKAESMSLKG
ncbi:MAG: ABC transporter permease subunit [Rhodobacteraceae bacterium]|nr:ABC transporter permease subunit [Paracoccaceae bacterium]